MVAAPSGFDIKTFEIAETTILFDDALIMTPVLYGEFFPLVAGPVGVGHHVGPAIPHKGGG